MEGNTGNLSDKNNEFLAVQQGADSYLINKLAYIMSLEKEAVIFTNYLTGTRPSSDIIERYVHACEKLNLSLEGKDEKYTQVVLRRPFLLPFVDAALAPQPEKTYLRKKIWVMLAILETTTAYYPVFTSKNYSFAGWILIFYKGVRSVIKFLIGTIILLFI